jgi:hypothetical protein
VSFIRECFYEESHYVLSTGNGIQLEIWNALNFRDKKQHGEFLNENIMKQILEKNF